MKRVLCTTVCRAALRAPTYLNLAQGASTKARLQPHRPILGRPVLVRTITTSNNLAPGAERHTKLQETNFINKVRGLPVESLTKKDIRAYASALTRAYAINESYLEGTIECPPSDYTLAVLSLVTKASATGVTSIYDAAERLKENLKPQNGFWDTLFEYNEVTGLSPGHSGYKDRREMLEQIAVHYRELSYKEPGNKNAKWHAEVYSGILEDKH